MADEGENENSPLLSTTGQKQGARETRDAKETRRQYLLEIIVFLYMLAYIMSDYVCYQYIYSRASEDLRFNNTGNFSQCDVDHTSSVYKLQQKVGAEASSWQLYYALASGLPGLFTGMIFGAYSDRIGRRYIMVISSVGVCGRLTAYILSTQYHFSLDYILVGYFLEGVGGSFTSMFLACSAYAADVTEPGSKRTIRMIIVFIASGLSEGVAYLSSGYAITELGYQTAFLIVLGTFGLTIVFVACLPESRFGKHMPKMSFCQHMSQVSSFYVQDKSTNPNRHVYILCGLSLMFGVLANVQRSGIELLYLLDSPFCWSSIYVGDFQAVAHTSQKVICLVSMVVLVKWLSEEVTGITFGLIILASYILESFAKTDIIMYIVALLTFPSVNSTLFQRTIVSSLTDVEKQGALFASVQLMESSGNTLGTVLSNLVYSSTVHIMPGAVFLYFAGLEAVSILLLLILLIKKRQGQKTVEDNLVN